MRHKELIIVQSEGGGPVTGRGISCHAGQITVFRSFTDSGLRPFQQLFLSRPPAGISGMFEVRLDGLPFSAGEHLIIGMEKDFSDPNQRLWEYLREVGVPSEHVPHLLTTYNLPHSDERCIDLPPNLARTIRIIGASYQAEKVLILNDPFVPLSVEWRERLADFIATQAKSMQQIVVVTALSARPQCWIGNELISRVQIEEQFNMTIGYGPSAAQLNMLVQQVRNDSASMPAQPPPAAGRANPHRSAAGSLTAVLKHSGESVASDLRTKFVAAGLPDQIEKLKQSLIGKRQWQPFHTFSLALAVACCFFALKLWSSRAEKSAPITSRIPAVSAGDSPLAQTPARSNTSASPLDSVNNTPEIAGRGTNGGTDQPPTVLARRSLLDNYPPEIRQSILHSIQGIVSAPPARESTAAEPPIRQPAEHRSEPADQTEEPMTEEEGRAEETEAEVRAMSSEAAEWEARREAMRTNFLAAIQAAQQQEQDVAPGE